MHVDAQRPAIPRVCGRWSGRGQKKLCSKG
jgi:hypothetical protein